jgi:hypothetical protein
MKIFLATLPSILLLLVFGAACTKGDNATTTASLESISSNAVTPDLSKCKMRRIYQQINEFRTETAVFTYNAAGNPYSVIYSNSGTTLANHHFFYDSKNRLKEYQLKWGEYYVHQYHYYRYNDKDQIIVDSTLISDANEAYPYVYVSTLEYDAFGRVVKETIGNKKNGDAPLLPTRRPTFTYDVRGNLAVANWKSSSYDNKINPLRQNKVFQFIFRNYSLNNAAVQPKYYSLGLPLSMKPSNDGFFNASETFKVIYDCQ